jgi:hypothetical protein
MAQRYKQLVVGWLPTRKEGGRQSITVLHEGGDATTDREKRAWLLRCNTRASTPHRILLPLTGILDERPHLSPEANWSFVYRLRATNIHGPGFSSCSPDRSVTKTKPLGPILVLAEDGFCLPLSMYIILPLCLISHLHGHCSMVYPVRSGKTSPRASSLRATPNLRLSPLPRPTCSIPICLNRSYM